jgi:hypothetical protein
MSAGLPCGDFRRNQIDETVFVSEGLKSGKNSCDFVMPSGVFSSQKPASAVTDMTVISQLNKQSSQLDCDGDQQKKQQQEQQAEIIAQCEFYKSTASASEKRRRDERRISLAAARSFSNTKHWMNGEEATFRDEELAARKRNQGGGRRAWDDSRCLVTIDERSGSSFTKMMTEKIVSSVEKVGEKLRRRHFGGIVMPLAPISSSSSKFDNNFTTTDESIHIKFDLFVSHCW